MGPNLGAAPNTAFRLEVSNYCYTFKGNSDNSQPFCSLRSLQNFSLSEWRSAYASWKASSERASLNPLQKPRRACSAKDYHRL